MNTGINELFAIYFQGRQTGGGGWGVSTPPDFEKFF